MTPLLGAGTTTAVLGATAVAALLLVVLAYESVGALVTLVHEGGHVAANVLTGRRVRHFEVHDGSSGVTYGEDRGWGPGRILVGAAGYAAPPLLGLGGAALLARGAVQPLLWTAVILLVLGLVKAEKEWTTALVLVAAVALGYTALYGSTMLRGAIAAGLVWLLLFGGIRDVLESSRADGSDVAHLAHDTLIPRIVWWAGFVALALYCLWQGFLLLKP